GDEGVDGKRAGGEAEDERAVRADVARYRLEVYPAEDEGKRDGEGEDAAPHDQRVGHAAGPPAPEDEAVQRKIGRDAREPVADVRRQILAAEEYLPAAVPIAARRRALQPHRVAVRDGKRGEEDGEGVADQRGVEVLQVARAD